MTMRTHFEFVSTAFPPLPGEEDETNPGRYGKALAAFLVSRLRAPGLEASEPIAEDWGWCVTFPNPDFRLWLGIGNRDDAINGWLVFAEPTKPHVRKLFRKIDKVSFVEPLILSAYASIEAHPETTDLRWWDDADMKLSGL